MNSWCTKIDGTNLEKYKSHLKMSFTLNCFAELVAKYDSWESLCAFLISEEGGKLRVIQPTDSDFALVRYTKDVSNFQKDHVTAFRSVVWNKKTNRPVCVAPVKAQDGTSVPEDLAIRVTDFVDGTMINAYRTDDTLDAAITSRSSLGANGKFYSEHSFAELFDDALKSVGGRVAFLNSVLKGGEFASFVLQHREHKVVGPVAYNRVFVAYFGSIDQAGVVTMSCKDMPERLASYMPEVFEESVKLGTYVEVDEGDGSHSPRPSKMTATNMVAVNKQRGYTWQGLVFQDLASSKRWRVRNHDYMMVRSLRGSEANPMERFLRLRAAGLTKKYLSYFREENQLMWSFEEALRKRTTDLYNAYIEMNKLKQKGMRDLPYCLRPHVYALHGLYLKSVKTQVSPIIKETVIGYVNALGLEDQFKLLSSPLTVPAAASTSASSASGIAGALAPSIPLAATTQAVDVA
jgi:hypothetical protein